MERRLGGHVLVTADEDLGSRGRKGVRSQVVVTSGNFERFLSLRRLNAEAATEVAKDLPGKSPLRRPRALEHVPRRRASPLQHTPSRTMWRQRHGLQYRGHRLRRTPKGCPQRYSRVLQVQLLDSWPACAKCRPYRKESFRRQAHKRVQQLRQPMRVVFQPQKPGCRSCHHPKKRSRRVEGPIARKVKVSQRGRTLRLKQKAKGASILRKPRKTNRIRNW